MRDVLLGFDPGPDVTVVIEPQGDPRAARAALRSAVGRRTRAFGVQVLLLARDEQAGARLARRAGRSADVELVPVGQGSPLEARNRALELARGRHLLLLEPGSLLLPDALQRAVALADRAESDVVLAAEPAARDAEDQERTRLVEAGLLRRLEVEPLLRTSMVRRAGLRFREGVPGARALLVAEALLAADAVSLAGRPFVETADRTGGRETAPDAATAAGALLELVAESGPAGADRDRLVEQVLSTVLARATGPLLVAERSPERREAALRTAQNVLRRFLTADVVHSLSAALAVRYRLIERGLLAEAEAVATHQHRKSPAPRVVEGGRLYAQYPGFRDPAHPVPDDVFEVSHELTVTQELTRLAWSGRSLQLEGIGFFEQLSTRDRDSELVLRERRTGAVERFPVEAVKDQQLTNAKGRPRSMGRFRRTLDLAMPPSGLVLGPGLWEVRLSVSFEGVTREVPFGAVRSAGADLLPRESVVLLPAAGPDGRELVAHHVVTRDGNLAIEVSERTPIRPTADSRDVRRGALRD